MMLYVYQSVVAQQFLRIRPWKICYKQSYDQHANLPQNSKKGITDYLGTSTLLSEGWRVFFCGLLLPSVASPAAAA
jgi:hypothetical protein